MTIAERPASEVAGGGVERAAVRIGYFVPEFPSQTHAFFWRELQALRRRGCECVIFSTRRPSAETRGRHEWVDELAGQTRYLLPMGPGGLWRAAKGLLAAGPAGWWRALAAVAGSECRGVGDRLRLLGMVPLAGGLAAMARAAGCDHIHVHSCANAASLALLAERLGGPSYSLTLHNPLRVFGGNQKMKWGHARFAVVITQRLLGEVRQTLGEAVPPVVRVAPMGVDTNRFRRERPYEPPAPGQPLRVFTCSRLHPSKRVSDLIRALAILRREGVEATLTVAGEDGSPDGWVRRRLASRIEELDLGDRVHLIGSVSEDRVRAELEAAHVFALVSTAEPLGVATMEAMAMELPVVVTGGGGVRELVEDGVHGRLVEPNAPEQIAAALRSLAAAPERAAAMGRAGRERIAERFHSGVSAEAILSCLDPERAEGAGAEAARAVAP